MKRRIFLSSVSALLAGGIVSCSKKCGKSAEKIPFSATLSGSKLNIFSDKIRGGGGKILFVADTHIAFPDGLVAPYDGYAARMAKYGLRSVGVLEKIVAKAESEKYAAIILGGDIFNYPSSKNIKEVLSVLSSSKVPCHYLAGNHDWHFEGEDGSDSEQRARWLAALKPLYFGENPLIYSKKICGVNFVMLDNSTYEISREQLDAFKRVLSEGLPVIVCAHIPFYVPGRDIFFCGDPEWGAKNDPYYKIERRQPWSPAGVSSTTSEFCELLFSAPNVWGVLAGHIHSQSEDWYCGKFQIVAPFGGRGGFVDISVTPTEKQKS